MQSLLKTIIFIGMSVPIFMSCRVSKETLQKSVKNNQLLSLQNDAVKGQLEKELEDGDIEPIIAQAFISSYEGVETKIKKRDALLKSESFSKMNAKKAKIILDSLDLVILKDKETLGILAHSLSIDSYYEFPSNALFGPGKYEITSDKESDLKMIFSPAIDSVSKFSNLYPNQKLSLFLVTYGFADATGFKAGSPLYEFLANQLSKTDPTKEELNLKLSELRAKEVVRFIETYSEERKADFKNYALLNKNISGVGKGEELPKKQIDYTEDDERRRIVKFFWKIVPSN